MRRAFLASACLLLAGTAAAADIHSCDIEVAHPSDPDHVGPGVPSSEVVTHRAIPACRAAIEAYPDVARFHYQLGRAIVYWAGANGADDAEGLEHLRHAADRDYTQALFVLGLMYLRDGKVCMVEPLTRQAAEQGLKSARLAYVNHVTAGLWQDCGDVADNATLHAWLDGAALQVAGYYENMLLDSLRRQLPEMDK